MSMSEADLNDGSGYTTVSIKEPTRQLLEEKKPFPSISLDDLIRDMAEKYEPEVSH